MNEGTSILAIGDVHLGTSCSGISDSISTWGVDARDLMPAAALENSVDFAIERNLDAVMFAGDVVESTNARFEALVPLEKAVRRLEDANIEVIAVAGNHDVEALPRLASLIDGFTLLGAGGRWESRMISKDNSPVAQVIGWSFGERHVRKSPVAELLRQPLDSPSRPVPRIGLLHADLNASGGTYAPVSRAELDDTGFDAWLLGHIHRPSLEDLSPSTGTRPYGYLGSLVGLDASETGPHGPWLLTVSKDGKIDLQHIPFAPLRWENLDVPVDGLQHIEDVLDKLLVQAEKRVLQIKEAGPAPKALGLRAHLTGTSACYREVRRYIARGEWKTIGRVVDGTAIFINRLIDEIELPLCLEDIASGNDPAALMAQRLLTLGRNDEQSRALLDNAREKLSAVAGNNIWFPVDDHRNASDPLSDDALRDALFRSGKAALNAMLSGDETKDSS